MKNTSFQEAINRWKETIGNNLTFPVIFMEGLNALEIRGFINLEQLIGDYDFSGYDTNDSAFIIDIKGNMFNLKFENNQLLPNKLIESNMDTERLYKIILPALNFENDSNGKLLFENGSSVQSIIKYLSDRYCW